MAHAMNGQENALPEPVVAPFESETEFDLSYDAKNDIFQMVRRSFAGRPAVSLDVDGEFWLRMDPETGEIFGVEIEDFEGNFLVTNPQLRAGWPEVRQRLTKSRRGSEASAIRAIAEYVGQAVRARPPQLRFA